MGRIRFPFLVVACLALSFLPVSLAGASSTRARGPELGLTVSVLRSTSTAGYVSEKIGIKTVFTTFEVPKITACGASEYAGLGPVVILLGHDYFVGAGAEAECLHGSLVYQVAINHNGSETHPLTVSATNEISVYISIGAKVSVKIEDLTTKQKASASLPKAKVTAAELGDDSLSSGGKQVPIPKFTDHRFTGAKINGKVLKKATPLFGEELVKGGSVLIEPGAIDRAGNAFVMHFEHAG